MPMNKKKKNNLINLNIILEIGINKKTKWSQDEHLNL